MAVTNIFVTVFDFTSFIVMSVIAGLDSVVTTHRPAADIRSRNPEPRTWTVPRGLPRGHMAPPNAILHAKHEKNIQGFLQES